MTATHDYGIAHGDTANVNKKSRDSALRHALRRNTYAAAGLLGLLICAAVAASLATWHVTDPSLSNATDLTPKNILGHGGAIVSDLLLQIFGLASAFLLIPPVIWFWRLVRLDLMRLNRTRAMAWIGGLGALSVAFATIPAPSGWPLPMSLGGMIGDGFLTVVNRLDTHFMQGLGAILVGTIFTTIGILLLLNALDVTLRNIVSRRSLTSESPDEEESYDDEEYEDDEAYDATPSHLNRELDGSLDRTKGPDARRTGPFAIVLGALSHWYLSRQAKKQQAKRRQETGHIAAGRNTAKPSLIKRGLHALLGEEDDGLELDASRLEPQLHGSHPHAQAHPDLPLHRQNVEPAHYAAQPPVPHYEEAGNTPPWSEDPHDPQGTLPLEEQPGYGAQPLGIAPPEINRAPNQPQPQAATNAHVAPRSTPANAPAGHGRRMIKGRGNIFTRKVEFQLPPIDFLAEPESLGPNAGLTADQLEHNARLLEGVLSDFGIRGEIIKVRPGPVVTLYELEPAPGIKSSRVIGLADDIARSMSAISARVAVVPGRNAIGIELPNARRETVYLREMLSSKDFEKSKAKLPICLGKNIGGDPVVVDLARMPHVLVAGTTGSGKSVSINTTIMSLLYRHTPEQCRLIMIDPKMLELSIYDGIPHLLTPVVTDPAKAVVALKWAVREMEMRYKNMSKMGVRNIDGFNKRVREALSKGEQVTRTIQTGFDPDTGDPIYEQEALNLEPMPFIVIVVDEMADLMMVAGKDIEGAIQRLAQMARAAGIHLIMATQRPSVDVITGTIKANFPTRMSFQVTSKIDSRTILGEMGAEQLLGMGDMLYMAGGGKTQRVHGAFVADEEVEEVVNHLKLQGTPDYLDAVTEETEEAADAGGSESGEGSDAETLYDKAVDIVIRDRKASTSYIQRRLSIGYNRAATLIEQMEEQGVISAANHAGKREVLVPEEGATM